MKTPEQHVNDFMAEMQKIIADEGYRPEWFGLQEGLCANFMTFCVLLELPDTVRLECYELFFNVRLKYIKEHSPSRSVAAPFNVSLEALCAESQAGMVYQNFERLEFIRNWKPLGTVK